jgi:formylglycine-generating enzyme required for sulfatase activity
MAVAMKPRARLASLSALALGAAFGCAHAPLDAPSRSPAAAPAAPEKTGPALELASAPPARTGNPSCTGAPGAGEDCNGESCCLRLDAPPGDFEMPIDALGKTEKTHVNAFALDKYEVTVGRLRAWVAAGSPVPAEGEVLFDDGAHRPIRWPRDAKVQTEKQLAGWKRYDTWTGGDERRPKNFLSWYTAAAFCHFDGGRLPTDAEWKYIATGGAERRPYPWGAEPPTPEHAVYNCTGDGDQSCSIADILPVGSRPRGAGLWGHRDLAGSMFEWTMDGGAADPGAVEEVSRGGGFCYIGGVDRRATTSLRPMVFRKESRSTVSHMVGARCAYDHRS